MATGAEDHVEWLLPETLPEEPMALTDFEALMLYGAAPVPPVVFCFRGTLDEERLSAALGRAVSKNPVVAGRIRTLPSQGWLFSCRRRAGADRKPGNTEIRFEGTKGVPLHVKAMDAGFEAEFELLTAEGLAREPLRADVLFQRLRIEDVGNTRELLDADRPLLSATYVVGERTCALSLSASHLLFDGWAYFELLRCWEQEYMDPGSSEPLSRSARPSVSSEMGHCIIRRMNAPPPREDCHMLTASFGEATLERIKLDVQVLAKRPPPERVSRNDTLTAWLGNVLGVKHVQLNANFRGRGAPARYLGNAWSYLLASPDGGVGHFDATDVRRSVEAGRKEVQYVPCKHEDYYIVTSWVKVQHLPSFGGELFASCFCRGGVQHLLACWTLGQHILFQCRSGEYYATYNGLSSERAAKLTEAFRELGVSAVSVASFQQVLETLKPASPS